MTDDACDEFPACPTCGEDLEWADCDACGGEGYFDDYADNPIEYLPGDTSPCHQCSGDGGWWFCGNTRCTRGVVEVSA